jgi:hypothetical protein
MPAWTKFSMLSVLLLFPLDADSAYAQQAGAAVGAARGSAARKQIHAVQVPPPNPTCGSPENAPPTSSALTVPELLFSREGLLCVRNSEGKSGQLAGNLPWGFASASKFEIAYWLPDTHELRVQSIHGIGDHLIDTLPGAIMRGIVWSAKGRTLAYFPAGAKPGGIRVIDLDSGFRKTISGSFVTLLRSPDPDYISAVGAEGVVRFRISDGARELVAPATYAAEASYSQSGALLGILVSTPGKTETASAATTPAPASPQANSPQVTPPASAPVAGDDDTPDCTGGSFALLVQRAATGQVLTIPAPKEFDSVLDFEFSPDDRYIAVTYGVTGCDYPGDSARIYQVQLSDLSMTAVSAADHLSVQAHWSPDGHSILYTDYSGSDSPLVAIDVRSGKITRLTNPGPFGPDTFIAWR